MAPASTAALPNTYLALYDVRATGVATGHYRIAAGIIVNGIAQELTSGSLELVSK